MAEPAAPGVSALVTCRDEERHIAACLAGLAWCDEVLLVDSGSSDRTLEIARGFANVRVLEHPYRGGAAQKNWALPRALHEWVLILDSDERCPEALREELRALFAAGPRSDAYALRRRTWYLGRRLRHSGVRHERVVRLVRRGSARYQDRRVHARMVDGEGRVLLERVPLLRAPLEHHMVESLPHHLERTRRYALWGAAQAWRDGERAGLASALGRGLWRFLRTYLVQLGILDGARGLAFCATQGIGSFMKGAILWSWERDQERGVAPELPEFEEADG